ncbi:SAV_6107 family HEPN domain-containing protein [Gordonia sp. DT30]|uniref:SAV_6107 family HEPN domain-containing protein n=1 Tax=unclassified Gordonia (in: high G+C Gram-positive bacteria) TaxID=2657482 RepID=UPI003CE93B4C
MMTRRTTHRAQVDPVVVGRARGLLERADNLLDNASGIADDAERFRQLYLTALRAAGAALAIGEPAYGRSTRGLSSNAWNRLAAVVPELADQAGRFCAWSSLRMNIEAGIERRVDPVVVAELHRLVLTFLDTVEGLVIAYEQGGGAPGSRSLAHPA